MELVALLAALALVIAAASLLRLSRKPPPPPAVVAERTFETLAAGDVVVTPQGDFLVEARAAVGEGAEAAPLFTLKSGREARFLWVPAKGPLGLFAQAPGSVAEARRALEDPKAQVLRPTVDLLPGT
jgi:hypothetical protein